MGKASKWFRALLGLKKSDQQMETTAGKPSKDKRSWSFVKSYREKDSRSNQSHGGSVKHRDQSTRTTRRDIAVRSIDSAERVVDPDKHAIAVAAATAAVAEAAVVAAHAAAAAAAHAAAAAVRLTNSGRCGNGSGHDSVVINQIREVRAAVKIQAAFRGCLARKALRALKGLVRLQALVRGHIERKQTSEWLLRMQAILRAQARARAGRAQMSELSQSSSKSSHFHLPGPATPEKFEHDVRTKSLKFDQPSMLRRNCSRSNHRAIVDQGEAQLLWHQSDGLDPRVNGDSQRDKILDIDMAKANRKTLFHSSKQVLSFDQHSHSFTTSKESNHQTPQYSSSCEVQSLTPLKFSYEAEEGSFCTAENSPQFHSASSKGANVKRSPFTPTKSDGSSYLSGYSDYPNYMCFTESSRAKIRSLSAPRQRPQYERSLSTKRSSAQSNGNHSAQKVNLHANFTSKAYPGSGRLDGLGMPVMPVGHRY